MSHSTTLRNGLLGLTLAAFVNPLVAQFPGNPFGGAMPSQTPGAAPVAGPQTLGPKAPGKIRIGVAPVQAQLGQGNNAQADYGAPIRNSIIMMMNGPAVEVAALDSRVPMQLQAEAQQKQCDFVLFSNVTVKHSQGGGFGKLLKAAGPMANMIPMVGMTNMAGAIATQAAAQTAQQLAMSQLSGFNKQIKSKDDVTVEYQLFGIGPDAATPKLQNTLTGKAKSDGEDVLTPIVQQVANTVLPEVVKH
jgi:hypothetical protein